MGRPGALLPGLLLALFTGCVSYPGTPAALVDRCRGFANVPADAVEMVVAVIEQRLGDPYLDKEVWTCTDEQVVDLEHKAVLEDNGFRIGQVVGMTPSGLQALLTSPRACPAGNAIRYLLGKGKSASLALGPSVPHAGFRVIQQGEPMEVSLDEAQFTLLVQPHLTGEGRTRLHFTPQVKYGENLRDFHVAPDGSGYVMEIKRPSKTFDGMSWDVTLAPNQYVIVGGRLNQPNRLGHESFIQGEGSGGVQRLLVIRTNRAPGGADEDDGDDSLADKRVEDCAPALARQATWPAPRGKVP